MCYNTVKPKVALLIIPLIPIVIALGKWNDGRLVVGILQLNTWSSGSQTFFDVTYMKKLARPYDARDNILRFNLQVKCDPKYKQFCCAPKDFDFGLSFSIEKLTLF